MDPATPRSLPAARVGSSPAVRTAALIASLRMLTLGSTMLLVAGVFLQNWAYGDLCLGLAWLAVAVHAGAWVKLGRWSWAERATRILFGGSIGAFLLGLATLPWILPPAWLEGALLNLPYVPSVFGPVLVFHAALFVAAARSVTVATPRAMIWLGSGFLCGLAAAALVEQAALLASIRPPVPFFALAGLSSIGYALVGLGLTSGLPHWYGMAG